MRNIVKYNSVDAAYNHNVLVIRNRGNVVRTHNVDAAYDPPANELYEVSLAAGKERTHLHCSVLSAMPRWGARVHTPTEAATVMTSATPCAQRRMLSLRPELGRDSVRCEAAIAVAACDLPTVYAWAIHVSRPAPRKDLHVVQLLAVNRARPCARTPS